MLDRAAEMEVLAAMAGDGVVPMELTETQANEWSSMLKALEAECEHLARITHLNDTSTDVFRDQSMALNKQLEEIRARTEDGAHRTAIYRHMQARLEDDRLLLDRQLERLGHLKKEAARGA